MQFGRNFLNFVHFIINRGSLSVQLSRPLIYSNVGIVYVSSFTFEFGGEKWNA